MESELHSKVHRIAALAKAKGYRADLATGAVFGPRKKLKLFQGRRGYLTFSVTNHLSADGTRQVFALPVHKFITYLLWGAEAFRPGLEVRHLNNKHHDNRASNLAMGTPLQNKLDRPAAERKRIAWEATKARLGKPGPRAKLTPRQVLAIRKRLSKGGTQRDIAQEYGVSPMAISRINTGDTYRYVPTRKEAA